MNFFFLFSVWLTFTSAQASPPRIEFDRQYLECTRIFFEESLTQWAQPDLQNPAAFVSTYDGLLKAMKKSGAQAGLAKLALKNVTAVLKKKHSPPVIKRISAALRDLQSHPDRLVFCTLLPGCQLRENRPLLHLYPMNGPFVLRRSTSVYPTEPGTVFKAEVDMDSHMKYVSQQLVKREAILVNPVSAIQSANPSLMWVADVFSRLSIFANIRFYQTWISANYTLDANGLTPDSFFQRFVSEDDSTPALEHGFYQMFNASTVSLTRYVFFLEAMHPNSSIPMMGYMDDQRHALTQLRALPWAVPVLEQLGINESNFHEIGRKIEMEMQQSIDRAAKL